MTTFTFRCEAHGYVDVTADQIQLWRDPTRCRSFFMFRCEGCDGLVWREATPFQLGVLFGNGVYHRDIPAELTERRSGPPLSNDDLITLHLELQEL